MDVRHLHFIIEVMEFCMFSASFVTSAGVAASVIVTFSLIYQC